VARLIQREQGLCLSMHKRVMYTRCHGAVDPDAGWPRVNPNYQSCMVYGTQKGGRGCVVYRPIVVQQYGGSVANAGGRVSPVTHLGLRVNPV